jgi:hypothetical protein
MPPTARSLVRARLQDFVGDACGPGTPERAIAAPGCRLRPAAERSARRGSRRTGVGMTPLLTAHAPLRPGVRRSAGDLRQKESIT